MLRKEDHQSHFHTLKRLANGHPGAIIALLDLLRCGRDIQVPVSADAAWCLCKLDELDIRGVALCRLWDDVCNHNASSMIEMLRSCESELVDTTRGTVIDADVGLRAGDWPQNDRLGIE
jgi:hypothetical protein